MTPGLRELTGIPIAPHGKKEKHAKSYNATNQDRLAALTPPLKRQAIRSRLPTSNS